LIKASTIQELSMKVDNQLVKWAEQEQRKRIRAAIDDEKSQAEFDTIEAQQLIESYNTLLMATLSVNDRLNWNALKKYKAFKAFTFSDQVPTLESISIRLNVPKQSFLEYIFKSRARARKAKEEEADEKLQQELKAYEDKKAAAQSDYDSKKTLYEDELLAHNNSIDKFQLDFEAGDPTAIENYIRLVLEKSIYPDAISKEFDVQYEEGSNIVIVNYWLPNPNDLPRIIEYKYIAIRRETKSVEMKQKDFESFYENTLLQITLRTFHEIFESVYTTHVKTIVFNGWVRGIDPQTGNDFTSCVLSCSASREVFEGFNLARVTPKECFKSLKGLVAGSLSMLAPVKPILDINREDRRFIESRDILADINSIPNLATMDWADFEHLIRELFAKEFSEDNSEVRVTRASRDYGVDAIAFDPNPIKGGKFVIQAKRYNNIVPVSAVRDLYGTMINEGAVKGILVTTSYYGNDSREFAKDKPLALIDGNNLIYMLEKHGYNARIHLQKKS